MRYTHLFDTNLYNNDLTSSIVVTIATEIVKNDIVIGYSIKAKNDKYVKKTGNEHARQRAITSFPLPACFTTDVDIKIWSVLITKYVIERDFGSNRTPLLEEVLDILSANLTRLIAKVLDENVHIRPKHTAHAILSDVTVEIAFLLEHPTGNKFEDEFSLYWFRMLEKYNTQACKLSKFGTIDFSSIEKLI